MDTPTEMITGTELDPARETPPGARTSSATWKLLAIVGSAVVVVVVLISVTLGFAKTSRGLDGSWQDATRSATWTFQKGALTATLDDGATCAGTYVPDGAFMRITFHCDDENSPESYVGSVALSPDKNVAGVAEVEGDDWAPCLVRVGSKQASLESSALTPECGALAGKASSAASASDAS